MLVQKKIMWQKYEDVIENQINSPLLQIISKSLHNDRIGESMSQESSFETDDEEIVSQNVVIGVPDDVTSEVSLTSNFDCWIAHTNFNITDAVKNNLNKVTGIEVLKICSRYRFFIGVGRMFKFPDVRKLVEDLLLEKQNE